MQYNYSEPFFSLSLFFQGANVEINRVIAVGKYYNGMQDDLHKMLVLVVLGLIDLSKQCRPGSNCSIRLYSFIALCYYSKHIRPGPSCSKLTTLLVNISLKFQMLISENSQYFLLKQCEKLLQKLLSFFQQKISVYWL